MASSETRPARAPVRAVRYSALVAVLALAAGGAPVSSAAGRWHGLLEAESGTPGGWVQVRENSIAGTQLHMADLHADQWRTLRLAAWRDLSEVSAVRVSLSASTIRGSTLLDHPVVYNGTLIAPGRLDTTTRYPDFWALRGGYWRRLLHFPQGGGLWSSVGLTFVGLTFRLHGQIDPSSVGHETKEDFITQELPVPTLGAHLRYPLTPRILLLADLSGSHLPWIYSLRHEGGAVRITQSSVEERLGLSGRVARGWRLRAYWFDRYFAQYESSGEDGNAIKLTSHGFGLGLAHDF